MLYAYMGLHLVIRSYMDQHVLLKHVILFSKSNRANFVVLH